MNHNWESYQDFFLDYFEGSSSWDEISDIFDSIDFKTKRNLYHFRNIAELIQHSRDMDRDDFYESINLPIYYEIEGFLTSLRSSVDILLHLINRVFSLGIPANDVSIHKIYHDQRLPKAIKNIFDRFTRTNDNQTWFFIYTFRNNIIHEKSINQLLSLKIPLPQEGHPIVFLEFEKTEKELLSFFRNCLSFIDNFHDQILENIKALLQNGHYS